MLFVDIIGSTSLAEDRPPDEVVTLAHGAGGKATRALVEGLFLEELGNPLLDPLGDSAFVELNGSRLAFTRMFRTGFPPPRE